MENGKRRVLRDDYTGRIESVNLDLLNLLLDHGYTPVLTPPAVSREGEAINVDGDRAVAVLGAALGVDKLVILSNIPGLLRDLEDETSLIREIPLEEADVFMEFAQGRMKKKLLGAVEAVQQGVREVVFGDARLPDPISQALSGKGTVIRRRATDGDL